MRLLVAVLKASGKYPCISLSRTQASTESLLQEELHCRPWTPKSNSSHSAPSIGCTVEGSQVSKSSTSNRTWPSKQVAIRSLHREKSPETRACSRRPRRTRNSHRMLWNRKASRWCRKRPQGLSWCSRCRSPALLEEIHGRTGVSATQAPCRSTSRTTCSLRLIEHHRALATGLRMLVYPRNCFSSSEAKRASSRRNLSMTCRIRV